MGGHMSHRHPRGGGHGGGGGGGGGGGFADAEEAAEEEEGEEEEEEEGGRGSVEEVADPAYLQEEASALLVEGLGLLPGGGEEGGEEEEGDGGAGEEEEALAEEDVGGDDGGGGAMGGGGGGGAPPPDDPRARAAVLEFSRNARNLERAADYANKHGASFAFLKTVAELGLSVAKAATLRRSFAAYGKPYGAPPPPSLPAALRHAKRAAELYHGLPIGGHTFVVDTRNNALGLKTCTVTISLRDEVRKVLGSPRFPPGSFRCFNGAPSRFVELGIAGPAAHSPKFEQLSQVVIAEFEASPTAPVLRAWAAASGCVLRLFPLVLDFGEDAMLLKKRGTVDPALARIMNACAELQDTPDVFIPVAILEKMKAVMEGATGKQRIAPDSEIKMWFDQDYQRELYKGTWKQLTDWDVPLLLSIPGAEEAVATACCLCNYEVVGGLCTNPAPCAFTAGTHELPIVHCVIPIFGDLVGDIMGLITTSGLTKTACATCYVRPDRLGVWPPPGGPPKLRCDPVLLAEVNDLYETMRACMGTGDVKGMKAAAATLYLRHGLKSAPVPAWRMVETSYRVPFSMPGSPGLHAAIAEEPLHVFKQGLFEALPLAVITCAETLGTFDKLDSIFRAVAAEPFCDGVRVFESMSSGGLRVSLATLPGRTRETIFRSLILALSLDVIPDPAQLGDVISVLEDVALYHHLAVHTLAVPNELLRMEQELCPRIFRCIDALRPFQASAFNIPKMHKLPHLPDTMRRVGSARNSAMEGHEGFNGKVIQAAGARTGGSFSLLHGQLAGVLTRQSFLGHVVPHFFAATAEELAHHPAPTPSVRVTPTRTKERAVTGGDAVRLLWETQGVVTASGGFVPPAVLPAFAGADPRGLNGVKVERHVHGWKLTEGILAEGSFCSETGSREPEERLLQVCAAFTTASLEAAVDGAEAPPRACFVVVRRWEMDPDFLVGGTSTTGHRFHRVYMGTPYAEIREVATVFGLAKTWPVPLKGSPGALVQGRRFWAPELERGYPKK